MLYLWLILVTCLTKFALAGPALADDWSQWRGPNRNGVVTSSLRFGPQSKVTTQWTAEVGTGFSSVVVSGDKLVTLGNIDHQDVVSCLSLLTGEKLWSEQSPAPLDPNLFEGGPTSTPLITDQEVITVSRLGQVFCRRLTDGAIVWQYDITKELKYNVPTWGFSGSPLRYKDTILLNAGSHGICLNAKTGKLIWSSSNDVDAGYSSPILVSPESSESAGNENVLMLNAKAIYSVDAQSGEIRWEERWITRYGINAADPLLIDSSHLLVSSGYGKGTAMIQFSNDESKLAWRKRDIKTQMSPGIVTQGIAFAIDGDEGDSPNLVCFEPKTGDIRWIETEFGAGSMIATQEQLLILKENGKLVVCDLDSETYAPDSELSINSGKCWTPPVLVENKVISRNASGTVTCSLVQ